MAYFISFKCVYSVVFFFDALNCHSCLKRMRFEIFCIFFCLNRDDPMEKKNVFNASTCRQKTVASNSAVACLNNYNPSIGSCRMFVSQSVFNDKIKYALETRV